MLVVAVMVTGMLLCRLDVWQFLAVLILTSLVAASSSVAALQTIPGSARFLLLTVLVGWLLIRRRPARRLRTTRAVVAACHGAVVFVVFAGASAAWSAAPLHTLSQTLALAMTGLAVVLAATRRWTSAAKLAGDMRVLLAVLVVLSAVSLLGALTQASFAYGYRGRYTGLFLSATSTGMVAALAVPLAWGLRVTSRHSWPYWGAIAIAMATLLVSESRGSMVALFGAGAWMAWRGGTRRRIRLIAGASVVLAGAFLVETSLETRTPLGATVDKFVPSEGEDYSTTRLAVWSHAVSLWQERPFIGHGFRQSERLFREQRAMGGLPAYSPDTTHNGFLQMLVELGVIGLGIFVVTVFHLMRAARRGRSALHLGLFGVVLVGLLLQFTESPIVGTGSIFPFVFWSIVGAALALSGHEDRIGDVGSSGDRRPRQRRGKVALPR